MHGVEAVLKAAKKGGAESSSDDEHAAEHAAPTLSELGKVCLCISVGEADAPAARIQLTDFVTGEVAGTRVNTGRLPGPKTPAKNIFLRVRVCEPSSARELGQRLPMVRESEAHPWYGGVLVSMKAAAPHLARVLADGPYNNNLAKFAKELDGAAVTEGPSEAATATGKRFRMLLGRFVDRAGKKKK